MKTIRYFFTLLPLITVVQVHAQFSFTTEKELSLEITHPYETLEFHCVPNPLSDMSITWQLVEMDPGLPSGWTYTICDHICYPFFPQQGNPVSYTLEEFNNGADYKLELGVSVNGYEGSGFLKYYIHNANNPDYGDTVTYHLSYHSSGIHEPENKTSSIHYTQSNGILSLFTVSENEQEIRLFSADGICLYTGKIQQTVTIETPLPNGIYFLHVNQQEVTEIVIFN